MNLLKKLNSSSLRKATRRRVESCRPIARKIELLEERRLLATIPVTLASDAVNPDGTDGGITLREAITYVNTGVVELVFPPQTEPA